LSDLFSTDFWRTESAQNRQKKQAAQMNRRVLRAFPRRP
jgi:hypothetical protein